MENYNNNYRKLRIPPSEFNRAPNRKGAPRIDIEPLSSPPKDSAFYEIALDREKNKNAKLKAEVARLEDDSDMRKHYAGKAYVLARNTLIGWGIIIFLYILSPDKEKVMSEKIFITITSACTINVIAAFIAVVKGLFSSKGDTTELVPQKEKDDK